WEDGVAQDRSDGTIYVDVYSVAVTGTDVYVVGYETNSSGNPVLTLWKNGMAQTLSSGEDSGYPPTVSVVVSGTDVYVAGYEKNSAGTRVATLWKNSFAQTLSGSRASSVAISGTDEYVAGVKINNSGTEMVARLWKNGEAQDLPSGSSLAEATSVAVVQAE